MKRVLSFALCAVLFTAAFTSCESDPKPDGLVGVSEFAFTKAVNSSLDSDYRGTINESAKTIKFTVPVGKSLSNVIPTFTATEYDVVSVAGKEVVSGQTAVSVANGTKITVKDEISALDAEYTVVVDENDGVAELVSVVFEAASNDLLDEDVAVAEVSEQMIVRVPAKAFMQELTIKVAAGFNDQIKINGEVSESGVAVVDAAFPIDITVTDLVCGSNSKYVVKVGKILNVVVNKMGTFSEGTMATDVAMEISPVDNMPYLAYARKAEGESNNRMAVVKFNGTAFEQVGVSGFSADTKAATRFTMVMDNNGTPYVKYVGGEVASKNTVQKFNGAAWEIVGEAGKIYANNVNTSYSYPIVFEEGADQPTVFFNGNTKNDAGPYRNMNLSRFDGLGWTANVASGVPVYGANPSKGASSGMYYNSVATKANDGKVYMVSAFNEYGFYVHELTGNGVLTPIIEDYYPAGEKCGLPGNIGIACNAKGEPFIFEAIWSANKMQIYKVDVANKALIEYAAGLPISISSSGGTSQDAAFGINNTLNLFVAVVDGGEDGKGAPEFKYLDESLTWNDFTVAEEAAPSKSAFTIKTDANGNTYVAYASANGLELYKIALEEDILPE